MDIVILEDDPKFAQNLESIITSSFKTLVIAANTGNLQNITDYINKMNSPALFLLDIVIGKENTGFKAARLIAESKVKSLIIFITDYPNKIMFNPVYKINSYNIILKRSPCFEDELKITIESALRDIFIDKCFIYQDRFTRLSIDVEGIIYIETVKGKRQICIYHENGVYMLNMRMNVMLQKLGSGFCRCHNSYIVHLKKIIEINHRERKIIMSNGSICYYSYLKENEFLSCLKERNPL